MNDCTQEAMLRCEHVLSITVGPTVTEKVTKMQKTLPSQRTVEYRSRSNIDDCIQEAMLRCLQVPSITTVGAIFTEKLT